MNIPADIEFFTAAETALMERAVDFARLRMSTLQPSHGWDHVERVIANALDITATEPSADRFVVTLAAILHDIARAEQDRSGGKICHAERGSAEAMEFLLEQRLDEGRAGHISQCILTHRFRKSDRPATLEAEILFDADKLESIGAIGIGRAFLFAGEVGARLHDPDIKVHRTASYSEEDTAYREFLVKLRSVKDTMLTRRGRELAAARHDFMEVFFARLNDEAHGKA
jgi:uncharacterized protein